MSVLSQRLPWTKSPLIVGAPMGGIAKAPLAIAITRASGLGQIGGTSDLEDLEKQLIAADAALTKTKEGLLPIGVGLLTFLTNPDNALALLSRFPPAVIWLFAAPQIADYATWTSLARAACPRSQVWIQVGSVAAALEVATSCSPDALCIQGADAGGHGIQGAAGLISLLPEASDALAAAGYGGIPLLASGGIAEARAAAAAFVLGAAGVVIGTRFLSAPEATIHPAWRDAVVAATDGGSSTAKSKVFDELRGPNMWPVAYDGRSLKMESWRDHEEGVGIEEIRKRHKAAINGPDAGFNAQGKGRAAMWAGTGVGHARRVQPAAEIVEELRTGIEPALKALRGRI